MNLSDEQKSAVASWLEAGASLSEVQKRLRDEFQLSATYLDVRLLVDDLRLSLKDPEPEEPPVALAAPADAAPAEELPYPDDDLDALPPAGPGSVRVTIDQIMKPGTMISGHVTFTDGEKAAWYLDQMGRLGLDPDTPGYRPVETDVLAFQVELQRLARAQGY